MADLSLTGLASGVDTDSIVSQLVELERAGVARYTTRTKRINAQDNALKDIQAKLKTLRSAAEVLRSTSLWGDAQSVTSSDATRVSVAKPVGVAPPGAFTVEVSKLATGARQDLVWVNPTADTSELILTEPAPGTGTWKLGNIAKDATIEQIVTAINADSTAPVYAAKVGTGAEERLVLTSRTTGSDQKPWAATLKDVGTGVSAAMPQTYFVDGTNAEYKVNGGALDATSKDNTITVNGLEITLKAPTSGSVVITSGEPALDKTALKDKIKAFLTAYNELVTATRTRLDERVAKEPKTDIEAARGNLFGDASLTSMLSRLRNAVADAVAGIAETDFDTLFDIGISTGKGADGKSSAEAKTGTLTIDDAKLDAALANPFKVRDLFNGKDGNPGFAQRLERFIDIDAGTGGSIDERIKGNSKELDRLKKQSERAEERIAAKEKRLRAQFASMEAMLGQSQTQGAWLSGQMAGLPGF